MVQSYIQIKRAVYIDAYYYHRHLIRQGNVWERKKKEIDVQLDEIMADMFGKR